MMLGNEIFNDLNLMLQLNHHIQSVSATPEGARLLTPATSSNPSASLEKKTSFKVLTDLESVTSSESREDAQFDHQRSVFTSLCSSDLPFHLQGDKDFNEASAMAKRRALRFSKAIKDRIEFLWEVAGGKKQAEMAQRTRHQQHEEQEQGRNRQSEQSVRRAGAGNGVRSILPPIEELDEEDYMALMLLIFKALRDDFVLELAHKQIQCDWEVDSHHGKSLSFEQFAAAIFELVDVWTCDIEEVTYVRFLELLTRRITRRVVVFLDGAELKLSLSDNFEPDIVVKSIPLRTIPKFVTIARVVAATGMRTVGELARADPKVVERERVEFLQRNNGGVVPTGNEMRKIGQDLQALLAMFKSISSQFANINYILENNVLRKLPSAASPRRHQDEKKWDGDHDSPGQENRSPECTAANGNMNQLSEASVDNGSVFVKPRSSNAGSDGCYSGSVGFQTNNHASSIAVTNGTRHAGSHETTAAEGQPKGTLPGLLVCDSNDRDLVAKNSAGTNSEITPLSKRNTTTVNKSDSDSPPTNSRTRDSNERCVHNPHQLNTIYDLHGADASVVNSLRSAFLIEKAISIERQTEIDSIRAELIKFNVGIAVSMLTEENVRDRYNALYDMLVLRDGESIKALAGVMLEQIKLQLSKYGIFVDDEERVEEVYDGFFESVLSGSGESIVQDAQRWMEDTVQDNKINDYIQHGFHELSTVDEVELLGTKSGDEEFLALLTKETDVIDEVIEDTEYPVERKNSSLIQRSPSRAAMPHLTNVMDNLYHTNGSQTKPASPAQVSLPQSLPERVVTSEVNDATAVAGDKKKKAKKQLGRMKASNEPPPQTLPASPAQPASSTPPMSSPVQTLQKTAEYVNVKHADSPSAQGQLEKPAATPRKNKLHISTRETKHAIESKTENLGPPTEATDTSVSDDAKRNRVPTTSRSRTNVDLEVDTPLEGKGDFHDTSENQTPREALNIALEFEGDAAGPGNTGLSIIEERPILMEPKVPKIAIGGAQSANNVPVTGRYIQLLGLGSVLIMSGERELFQLLRSPEATGIDLVCYDIGTDLDTALVKLEAIQLHVGNRVILFGGNVDEPDKTQRIALDCLSHGALYFASIPFNFPRLREEIMAFFENSKQPYILRQRKPLGQTAHVGASIGSGSLFALHDEPRKASTSVAYAKTPRRKLAATISALPSLPQSPRESMQPQPLSQALSEIRRADFTPIAPGTPRSSQSRNRPPRLSSALNKLLR